MFPHSLHNKLRNWKLHLATGKTLEEIASEINPVVQGWINYYGRFFRSELSPVLYHINEELARWVKRKYKKMRGHFRRAIYWLGGVAKSNPQLYAHWKMVKPPC